MVDRPSPINSPASFTVSNSGRGGSSVLSKWPLTCGGEGCGAVVRLRQGVAATQGLIDPPTQFLSTDAPYSYAMDNPVNVVDSLGLKGWHLFVTAVINSACYASGIDLSCNTCMGNYAWHWHHFEGSIDGPGLSDEEKAAFNRACEFDVLGCAFGYHPYPPGQSGKTVKAYVNKEVQSYLRWAHWQHEEELVSQEIQEQSSDEGGFLGCVTGGVLGAAEGSEAGLGLFLGFILFVPVAGIVFDAATIASMGAAVGAIGGCLGLNTGVPP
jgi:hypothetical protein